MSHLEEGRQRVRVGDALAGTLPEAALDRLVRLAARMLEMPVAALAFREGDRCRVIAAVGLERTVLAADTSFSGRVMQAADPFVVRDPEAPFAEHGAMAADASLRVYAGAPIIVDAVAIGALCVMGPESRFRDADAAERLEMLAATVVDVLASRAVRMNDRARTGDGTDAVRGQESFSRDVPFRLLFERNPLPMWVYDRQSLEFMAVNEAAIRHYGYSRDEFLSMDIRDIRPSQLVERLTDYLDGDLPPLRHSGLWQHQRADGTVIDVDITSSEFAFEGREAALVVAQDVTHRVKAEQALRQNEEQYRTLVERSHDAIYIYRDHRLLYANKRTCELTGYTKDELLEVDVFDLIHPDDRERVQHFARRRTEGTAPSRYEARLLRADGMVRHGEFSVQAITYQGEYAVIGSIRDITERREAERTLRQREHKVQALYEAMGALTLAQTPHRVAARIQTLIADTLHYRISGVRYLEDGLLVPATVSDQVRERMPERPNYEVGEGSAAARAFRSGDTVIYDDILEVSTAENLGNVRATAYVPIGHYGVISVGSTEMGGIDPFDVTLLEILARNAENVLDRIEREDALRDARDEAKKMSRLKSAFLANMSHEIRTPLTSIIGFAEVLGKREPSEASELTRLIQRGGQRLLETINSVLDLSQLEAGSMELSPESIDVADEIRTTAELFAPQAREKGVTLTVDVAGGPLEAHLDTAALRRILNNLLGNAVKFTEEGGSVDVRLQRAHDHFTVTVEDTGIGIDEDFLPHLFEAFKQESTGNARVFEGSGLGLAITHELIHLMHGEIDVASEKGCGTRFVFQLPYDAVVD